jgi:uncharacterized membrane protein YfcA
MLFTEIDFYLFVISFLCAALSASTGLGGGVLFLMGLNVFVPLNNAIPIHGLIQLFNNLVRVVKLRAYLLPTICIPFSIGALIGFVFCFNILSNLDLGTLPYIIILVLVLYSLLKPKKMPELKIPDYGFGILGVFTGALGPIIGTVDPLLSPFFLRDDFTKENLIANKSFFQSLIHLSKIPFFIFLGFNYIQFGPVIIVLLLGGLLGSYTGLRILDRINRKVFIVLFKGILFLVAIKLVFNII